MKLTTLPAICLSFCLLTAFINADRQKFPQISGTTLNGKNITLPNTESKKFTLVAVASSIKAEQDLISWIDPVYHTLMGNIMFRTDMYFIPMTSGIKGVSEEVVKRKLKEGIDSSLYSYVLLYTGPVEEYVKTLNMKDKEKPYFFVINPRGEITYTTSGKYTEEKLEEITDQLSE
jgi:hypothetical protein